MFMYKLETFLKKKKKKNPFIDARFYCSRWKKIVHFGIENALHFYPDYSKFVEDIKQFFLTNMTDNEFEFVEPYLNDSVKWKFDYIVFRRVAYNSV